jgi:prophage maintenance system killer protein
VAWKGKMKKLEQDSIVIYSTLAKGVEVRVSKETLWLNQKMIADVFETSADNIGLHLKNIYREGELEEDSTAEESSVVQKEGGREVRRKIKQYNLDAIIAVGYRVNSKKATQFRRWATKILKDHMLIGYTLNRNRIQSNYNQFLKAVDDVKNLLPAGFAIDKDSVLELVNLFADTWLSLDAYDKDQLEIQGKTKKKVTLTAEKLNKALRELKQNLIAKGEATEIFGAERSEDSIAGIIGNIMQSFGGHDLYPSIEEKAAHLLYFIVKNHPFIDGNKRSGAYAFVWFLRQAKILDVMRMSPPALTAITLLIAESSPKDKDKMIGLVCRFLMKGQGD